MDDPASGYPYWYHRDTHETVWKNPYPKALGNRYKDSDSTIFHKERKVFVLLFTNHYPKILSIPKLNILSKHLTIAIPLSIQVTKLLLPSKLLLLQAKQNQLKDEWPQHRQKMKFGPLISCGSLMAMRIRGKEECEKIADVLNGLRLLSGDVMHPIPHLQNKIERFKLNEKMLLYRGNRRWLQKHRVGLLGKMCDVVWLCSAIHRKEEVKKCVTMNMNMKIDNGYEMEKRKGKGGEGSEDDRVRMSLGELRDVNEDAAMLYEYIMMVVNCGNGGGGGDVNDEEEEEEEEEEQPEVNE